MSLTSLCVMNVARQGVHDLVKIHQGQQAWEAARAEKTRQCFTQEKLSQYERTASEQSSRGSHHEINRLQLEEPRGSAPFTTVWPTAGSNDSRTISGTLARGDDGYLLDLCDISDKLSWKLGCLRLVDGGEKGGEEWREERKSKRSTDAAGVWDSVQREGDTKLRRGSLEKMFGKLARR